MRGTFEINKDDIVIEDISGGYVGSEEPVRCNHLVLILCHGGEATIEVNYSTHTIRKDTLFMVYPFDIIIRKSSSEDFVCTILAMPSISLTSFMAEFDIKRFEYVKHSPLFHLDAVHLDYIVKSFDIIKSTRNLVPPDKFNLVVEKQLVCLFCVFNHYITKCIGDKRDYREFVSRKRDLFRKFIKTLVDSHSLSREVLFYANELGVSCGYLNEVCNEVSNHSVKEIIDSTVAARLKYELSYTSKTIQELADEYNFPSQSYFCRYYKRITGMTPSDFRKKRAVE